MYCISCGQPNTQIINSRHNKKSPQVWRRRRCKSCGNTFTTYETVALDQIIVETGQKTAPFNHAKLLVSIAACFEHMPKRRAETAEALAQTIEAKVLKQGSKTSREAICELSYGVLKHFDHLASVQYAAKHAEILKRHLA